VTVLLKAWYKYTCLLTVEAQSSFTVEALLEPLHVCVVVFYMPDAEFPVPGITVLSLMSAFFVYYFNPLKCGGVR